MGFKQFRLDESAIAGASEHHDSMVSLGFSHEKSVRHKETWGESRKGVNHVYKKPTGTTGDWNRHFDHFTAKGMKPVGGPTGRHGHSVLAFPKGHEKY